jgi:hypothetical protein
MTAPAASAPAIHPAVAALMRRVIDFAALFPPASLDMHAAAEEYHRQVTSADGWMLGRFVLPAARLEEFESAAADVMPRDAARSWAFSALLGSDLEEDVARIEAFNARHRDARVGAVHVDTVELKTHAVHDVQHAAELLDRRFDTYMEVPCGGDPSAIVEAISQTTAKAKIRTGGVTPDAFPSSEQVLAFLSSCVARGVSFKATAGLHHAWQGDYRLTYAPDAPRGRMFGFLNILLATAALVGGASTQSASALLQATGTSNARLDDRGIEWNGAAFTTGTLEQAREYMTAFGSCSFNEPVADLRAAHWI